MAEFQKVLELLHSKDEKNISADEALTTEEENCEVLYNIALCHSFFNKYQSLSILNDLAEILNSKHRGQILLLTSIIHLSLNNTLEAENILKEAFHCDSDTVTPFLSKKTTTILPLNTTNPFAQLFPLLTFDIIKDPIIKIRPAVSLPRSTLPNIEFFVEKEAENFFTLNKITPRPEAPWLNRAKGSIQFTNVLVDYDEPSLISERDAKDIKDFKNSSQEFKRIIKSAAALRHFSSSVFKNPKTDDVAKQTKAPDDILNKIRDLCKENQND